MFIVDWNFLLKLQHLHVTVTETKRSVAHLVENGGSETGDQTFSTSRFCLR